MGASIPISRVICNVSIIPIIPSIPITSINVGGRLITHNLMDLLVASLRFTPSRYHGCGGSWFGCLLA